VTDVDIQRQIRRGRISRVLFAVPAAILAYLFVVHVASGAVFLGVVNAVSAALFVASMVLATTRIRIMRRTLAGTGAKSPPSMPARERALRRLASRPRRVMTPDDYKRLRELEAELGWEPGEAPEGRTSPAQVTGTLTASGDAFSATAALSGTGSLSAKARKSPACHCGKSAEEHAREWDEQVSASQGIPPARLTDGEVKDATEAAQHFAQLARVGRERCVGFCPICQDSGRNAREATAGSVQARLPEKSREATLATMEPGCRRYTVPWAMRADKDGRMWLNLNYQAHGSPGGTVSMRVERREDGYHVWPARHYGYALEAFDVRPLMPVAALEGDL
jgi:hypothetical protein